MNRNFTVSEFLIFLASGLALGCGFFAPNSNLAIRLIGLGVAASLALFHYYTPRISGLSADNPKVKTMRRMNLFSVIATAAAIGLMEWLPSFVAVDEDRMALLVVVVLITVIGNIAPKLPFNRNMGLRLPWTIRDEDTWIVAHRLLGYLTFPCAIVMALGGMLVDAKGFGMGVLAFWIGVPALYSCYFYFQKIRGLR